MVFDIYVISSSIIGYLMKKFDYEGRSIGPGFCPRTMMENNLRKSLITSSGDFSIFFTRPWLRLLWSRDRTSDLSLHPLVQKKRKGNPKEDTA